MDLISQIVATKDNVDLEEIQRDLDKLSTSYQSLRRKMERELNDSHKYLLRCIKLDRYIPCFTEEIDIMIDLVTDIEHRIKNLHETVTESEKMAMFIKIREISDCLNFLQNTNTVDSLMRSIDKVCENDILGAAHNLMESKSIINKGLKKEEFQNFYKCILKKCCLSLASLKLNLETKWNNAVTFTLNNKGKKGFTFTKLNISLNTDPSLENIFQCLSKIKYPVTKSFSEDFLDNLLKPVLFHSSKLTVHSTKGFVSLTLTYEDKLSKIPINKVLQSLLSIFNIINSHLNLRQDGDLHFISSVGSHCEDEFISLLIQHYLSNIPTDNSEDTILLCQQLLGVMLANNFIIKSNKLVNYLEDVLAGQNKNILTHYINSALVLLKKDLLNSVQTAPIEVVLATSDHNLHIPDVTMNTHVLRPENFDFLNKSNKKFLFSECHVSKSIGELVVFLEGILIKSFNESEPNATTMGRSVHEIIYMYLACPRLHASSPRHSALIFNNSMYLAVNLILLDRDYRTCYPVSEIVYKLQNLALSELDRVVTAEQAKLTESMRKSGLAKSFDLEKFPETTEIVMRGCIKQLQLLQSFWIGVLPADVYSMAMGHLCCRFIEEIISTVMSAQNINSNIKHSLHVLFTFISESIEQILKDEENIEKYVKNWAKWRELSVLFNASLSTVSVRWDKANGPLSHHFNPLQIRDIITALFPSSELRRQTLATII